MDNYGGSSPKRGGSRTKSAGGAKSGKDSKKSKDASKKMEGETKKVQRAEKNKKVLFSEIKRIIDKAEESASSPGGSFDAIVIPGQPGTTLSACKDAI